MQHRSIRNIITVILVIVLGVVALATPASAAAERPKLLPFPADKPAWCVPKVTKEACEAHNRLGYLWDRLIDPATQDAAVVAVLSPGASWFGDLNRKLPAAMQKGPDVRRCVVTHALNAAVEVYRKEREVRRYALLKFTLPGKKVTTFHKVYKEVFDAGIKAATNTAWVGVVHERLFLIGTDCNVL